MFEKARSLGVPLDEKTCMNLIGYYGKAGTGPLHLRWNFDNSGCKLVYL